MGVNNLSRVIVAKIEFQILPFGKRFTSTRIHVFVPSFVEIGKAEVTKPVCSIPDVKTLVFGPFLQGLWSDSFVHPIPLPSFVQIDPVSEEIHAKMSSGVIIISA